jgi:hypothetical protein
MKKQKCFKQQNNIQNIQRGKGRSRLSKFQQQPSRRKIIQRAAPSWA